MMGPMDVSQLHARRWWALAVMCMSLLVIALDNTILNVALPALATDLQASTSELQWIVDGYTLVFAGLLLTCGSLGDRFGRKGALAVGLLVFFVGSLAAAMSGTSTQLALSRAVMGVGAALIMPATLSLLTNIFTDPRSGDGRSGCGRRSPVPAAPSDRCSAASCSQHFWWGSVFLVNVPVCIVALVAGHYLLPQSRDPHAARLDPIGALLSIVGLVLLLWAIIEAPTHGWTDPQVVVVLRRRRSLVVAGFVVWELHTDHPMLDVRFFENRASRRPTWRSP